jgi:hypothetical protein
VSVVKPGLEIVADILKRLREAAASKKRHVLSRLREAFRKADESGNDDTSAIEDIVNE